MKTEDELDQLIESIREPDGAAYERARQHNDNLCKPLGSLGRLEDIYLRLSAIFPQGIPDFKKAVVVFAGDNGICCEGVSQNPQDTTYKVCLNILAGRSGLGRIASFYNCRVDLEDIAVLKDVASHTRFKVLAGTKNAMVGPAMTRQEALACLFAGCHKTRELIREGYNLIGAGEMGTGNTTTSAALISWVTGLAPEATTGFGSGITLAARDHKVKVIEKALAVNAPYRDPLDALAKLGGGDIAAMVGCYLTCAAHGLPFVLDGVISMAALALAVKLAPKVLAYAFSSHQSEEVGARAVIKELGLKPPFDLGMRLGEGAGAPLAMNLMECAVFTISGMASFRDVAVNKEDYIDIREETR